ncbi:MAG: matrixin family metalloprotease, partial [Bradymonadaceae bacterium]
MNRRFPFSLAAALLVLALVVPAPATAYVYLAPSQCPNGATWSSSNLPTDYYLNEEGCDDVSTFSDLKRAVEASFSAWETPCCSTFRADYAGKTAKSALDPASAENGEVVMSWREQNWPSQLGHPSKTLAFSNPQFKGCEIVSATTMFNGTAHTFSTGSSTTAHDIRDIATHEIGHVLGLGHTPRQQATMSAKYHTGMDELATDDTEGLCSLYGGGTCTCFNDSACFGTKRCIEGTCRKAPCDSDADCSGPKHCDTDSGQCVVPSCSTDGDCRSSYRCNRDGKCVPECTVCQPCSSRSDCGANAVCAQINDGGRCVTQCSADKSCPGNSECFAVTNQWGSRHHLCLNPGARSGDAEDLCPDSYTCSLDDDAPGETGTADATTGDGGLSDVCPSSGGAGASCPS